VSIVTHVTEIKVFVLKNADATELAQILTAVLTNKPKPLTKISPNRLSLIQFVTRTKEGKDLIASALQEGVLITPDPRTNSLVVSARTQNMPLLKALIEGLDATSPRKAQIRLFTLKNADARQMADILTELFRLSTTAGQNRRAVQYTLSTTQPVGKVGATATVGSDEQRALTVTVDARTNSLLVGGTKEYVEMVAEVIEELDASPAQQRTTKVYRLRNARATDIQTALRGILDQELQRLRGALGNDRLGAAQRLLEREVAVVAVPSEGSTENANTLLLSASPRYFKTLAAMIDELDAPPPQVLVQVLLAEVTLDDTTNIGLESGYTHTYGPGKGQSVRTNFGVAADVQSKGGFSVSITSGDFNFFLQALRDEGRMEILSRPQILASDNQNARINVGQNVPFVSNSRITEQGTTLNTIEYRDVGIILDVTPRINPDGFVKLEVSPEISSISTSSIAISEGLNATVFNLRQATTTVTVQDGHTIIIGGLITTKDEEREKKVPVLGDIPFIGNLFKSTTKVKERTELLIILTPHIVRTAINADTVTAGEVRRLRLLQGMERDGSTKSTIFTPLESLAPRQGGPTAAPGYHRKEMIPELDLAPKRPDDSRPAPKEAPK